MALIKGRGLTGGLMKGSYLGPSTQPPPEPETQLWSPVNNPDVLGFWHTDGSENFDLDGSNILVWKDRSGRGHLAKAYEGIPDQRPVLNGDKVSFFRSALQVFDKNNNPTVLGVSPDPKIAFVFISHPTSGGPATPFYMGTGGGSLLSFVSTDNLSWRHNDGNTIYDNYSPKNAQHLFSFFKESGPYSSTDRLRVDGVEISSTNRTTGDNSANITSPSLYIGGFLPTSGSNYEGTMSCMMILSNLDVLEKAEGFVAHLTGKTSLLASTHPYKSSPPPA